ncbi:MAG TPA: ABC transporter permease [Bacteroidales bacterium]|nr:ABC transporter permease [Bacteroidales bacterium]
MITLRSILRDKVFLILNVLGLTLGITGSILIMLFVRHEVSYENFHEKADRIYRVNMYANMEGKEISAAITAPPQARVFKEEFPEIEEAARYYYPMDQKVTVNNITYHEKNFFYADHDFLHVFNFPLENGDPNTVLSLPFSVILTPQTAQRLFGTGDVIGKSIILNNDQLYQVTGVVREIPGNTHFQFDYLASFNSLELSKTEFWLSQMLETYIVLQKDYPYQDLEEKFIGLLDKYVMPQIKMLIPVKANNYKEFEATGNVFRFHLQPLLNIHLNTKYMLSYGQSTDKVYIYFFLIVAAFLLFIAITNFMNLATARYSYRTKEVGIKKVIGSTRTQLMVQFLTESTVIAVLAVIIALTLVELILPGFNNFTGKHLAIGYLDHWYAIPVLLGLTILIGVLSGLYPAFYLSSFKPIEILKSKVQGGSRNIRLRSVLVVVQFTITIILLIGTFIVSAQLRFIRNKDLGFDKANVLVVKNTGDLGEQSETFREQVIKIPGVMLASRSWTFPGDIYSGSTYQIQGDSLDKMYHFEIIHGDYDFIPTLDMKIVQGRNFSREFSTDNAAIIINQRAVEFLGLKQPVGARLTTPNAQGGQDVFEIIGVIEDVYYKSLHERIEPTMIGLNTSKSNSYTIIKLSGEDAMQTIRQIEKTWKGILPDQALEYTFIDENLNTLYKAETRASRLFTMFSILAVFVACLGLLGLSAFTAEKRTKEIGIRKVHGATIPVILRLLSREIIILIGISSVIAWPVVYYFMHRWLQNFAYQTGINLIVFVISSLLALIIALVVVVYQSLRAARINPVVALKYE